MAKPGSQIHAVLACFKWRKDHGKILHNRELLQLWPSIGMSTLSILLGANKRWQAGTGEPYIQRLKKGEYCITRNGEKELKRLGVFKPEFWNPLAHSNEILPWFDCSKEIQRPQPLDTTLAQSFYNLGFRRDLMSLHKGYENIVAFCEVPQCGHRRHSIRRYFEPSGKLKVTIATCNLCKNEKVASIEDCKKVPDLWDEFA